MEKVQMNENTPEAIDEININGWGNSIFSISKSQIEELLAGKKISLISGGIVNTIQLEKQSETKSGYIKAKKFRKFGKV